MIRLALLFLFFSIIFCKVVAQTTPTFKLFLIGDAGEGDTTGATLHDLGVLLHDNPNSAVLFLGDNCYKPIPVFSWLGINLKIKGYDGSKMAKRRLTTQVNILKEYQGAAFFVPGNHDWWNTTNVKKGKKHLLEEQLFVEESLRNCTLLTNCTQATFLPVNGSPGPVSKEFNNGKTRIIFIDTYRLIIEEGRKDTALLNKFYSDLDNELNDATKKKQKIIVASHHPIHAKGKHSLPIAFWEGLLRRFKSSNANYPPYGRMAVHLDSLLKAHHRPDIYYVSGHEHSLEYFFNDSLHYLVSGAGSRIDQVKYKEVTNEVEYLIWNEEGFFEIDFYGKKETVLLYQRKENNAPLQMRCVAGCD